MAVRERSSGKLQRQSNRQRVRPSPRPGYGAKWLALCVLVVCAVSAGAARTAPECEPPHEPLVYVGDRDFPPYEYLDRAGRPTGFNILLIEHLARVSGATIEIRLLPWAEARRAREHGQADLFSAGFMPARAAQIDYLAPTTTVRSSLLMRPGRAHYPESGADVGGLRIAVQQGTPSIVEFQQLPPAARPTIVETEDHRASIRLLADETVDAAAGSGATLRWHAHDAGIRGAVEIPMNSRPYMLATQQGCGSARAELASALTTLKEQGVIDQIADRMLTDPPADARALRQVLILAAVLGAVAAGAFAWNHTLRRTVRARTSALRQALSEQQRLTEVIQSNQGRLAFAMDVIGEGEWEWDLVTNQIRASTRWAGSFGYKPDEAPTSYDTWMALVHPEDRDRVAAATRAHITGRAPRFESTYRVPRRTGEWLWVLDRGRIVKRDAAGKPLLMIGALKDITIQLEAERALQEAKEAAEATSRAKSTFLATISHEMRTPLNAVIGTAALLQDTPLTEEQRELLTLLRRSSDSLLAVVNDVLDFTKIESGRIELDERAFDLRQTISDAVSLVDHVARNKGLQLSIAFDLPPVVWVYGDETRLRQILLNLLSNGVKFTERGGVGVQVTVGECGDGRRRYDIAITDSGIGIPPDRRERLFRPFSQVDSSTTRRFGGTGLGLAISSRLADLMGARIDVETAHGEGSTFTLRVAFADAEPQIVPAAASASPQIESRSLRVIVAEDNAVNQVVQLRMLRRLGYEATVVENGVALLDAVNQRDYDLVFLDIQMPVMDGLTAAIELRRQGFSRLRIVALTADVTTETRQASAAAGIDEYISKPLTLGALAAALERAEAHFEPVS